MNKLHLESSIYQVKFGVSSMVWVCEHQTGYPDICEGCKQKGMSTSPVENIEDRPKQTQKRTN